MPYEWWNQFNKSNIEVKNRMDKPVDEKIIHLLSENFEDFNRAYGEKGMKADDFESFGASVHTMKSFLEGYDEFTALIRNRMIGK